VANVLAIADAVGPAASADTDNCPHGIQYTVGPTLVPTLAATDFFAHEHMIEGSNLIMALGQTMSLSFSFWTNTVGYYSVYLTNNGRDQSYVHSFQITTANTWTRIKVNGIPPFPTTGTWNWSDGVVGLYIGVVMACGSQWQTASPDKWNSGFFTGTATNTNLCTVVNNQVRISAIKLEASPTATYMSVAAFEDDFELMNRYWWSGFVYQSWTSGTPEVFVASASNQAFGSVFFPRQMAKVPTVVPWSWLNHTAGYVSSMSTSADIAIATLPATREGVAGQITATSTKGDVLAAILVADARIS
jgi:hypothetical protein